MAVKVVFNESAWRDYDEIYAWIADNSDHDTANAYLSRLLDFCATLTHFPRRGSPRDDLATGVRTVVFQNKTLVAYQANRDEVRIIRIFHQGRDPGRAFAT